MLNFRTFNIYRLTAPEGEVGNKREFADTGLIVTGSLDSATTEITAIVDGEFGKTFQMFSDDYTADVRIADSLRDGDESYDVKGVLSQSDGPGRGLQITLVKHVDE